MNPLQWNPHQQSICLSVFEFLLKHLVSAPSDEVVNYDGQVPDEQQSIEAQRDVTADLLVYEVHQDARGVQHDERQHHEIRNDCLGDPSLIVVHAEEPYS